MWTGLVNFWNSLNHIVQSIIVLFVTTVLMTVAQELQAPAACWSLLCLKGYVISGLQAGVLAVCALYAKSSLYK